MRKLVICTMVLTMVGCATISPKREVLQNILFSPGSPAVKVHSDLKLIGKIKGKGETKDIQSRRYHSISGESWVFLECDGKRITKGAMIQILEIGAKTAYWTPPFFKELEYPLEKGTVNLGRRRYEYVVASSMKGMGCDSERRFMREHEYSIPRILLIKGLVRAGGHQNQILERILYFERVSPRVLIDEQRIKAFMQRSEKYIQVLTRKEAAELREK